MQWWPLGLELLGRLWGLNLESLAELHAGSIGLHTGLRT